MEAQPASKNYFFGDCYKGVFSTMGTIFKKTTQPIVNEINRLKYLFRHNIFAAIISLICDPIVFAIITVFVLAVNLIDFVVLFFSMVVIDIFVFTVYFFTLCLDWTFCLLKGIVSHCPNCQKKFVLPTYICPKCGAKHTALRPSKYGIFMRKCNCGEKLPTTFFNGRQKLTAVCPSCNTVLKDGGQHIEIVIPVVGGPGAGKTCFISMAILQLEKVASKNGLSFAYSPTAYDDYEANKQSLQHGHPPIKSTDLRLKYYQFYLTPYGTKLKNLISLCDVAGEVYDDNDLIGEQIGYKNANAFLMLIDPLSIAKFRKEVESSINLSQYGASEKPLDEILSTLISTLENMRCISSRTEIKTGVAVVFTKCDIPGLKEKIGKDAIRDYLQTHADASVYDATNELCENFLIEYEEENFLNTLKSKFKNIQFFTCSALGHVANGSAFVSDSVEDPVLWVIDKASASIDLREKWGKKL